MRNVQKSLKFRCGIFSCIWGPASGSSISQWILLDWKKRGNSVAPTVYHERYIGEKSDFREWFTKEMPYKIVAFTKRQFRCTYIMGVIYEKLMILESDLLRKSLIRFLLLLKDRSVAPISWVQHTSKYILESHLVNKSFMKVLFLIKSISITLIWQPSYYSEGFVHICIYPIFTWFTECIKSA